MHAYTDSIEAAPVLFFVSNGSVKGLQALILANLRAEDYYVSLTQFSSYRA